VGERAIAAIERALADEGPQTRAQLRAILEEGGFPTAEQAFSHLCFRAGVLGILVRGPMIGNQHACVLARDWLGEAGAVDRDRALAELARRYLAGHAPADDRDLARWAGLPLRDARAGLAAISAEIEEREDGLYQLAGQSLQGEIPAPRLLGAFDPVLLGWTSREEITGPHTELVTTNGLFRPFAMVNGRAVATWRLVKGKVAIEPLQRISKADRAALDADAADVERFMEDR
jgi:Winged helix DNA-binding domain